ncbi:MAG: phage holin family protein, partial [Gammaproteobacteria bacterium]
MSDTDESRGPVRQLLASVSGLFATLIGIGRTRLELLSVEIREEIDRTAGLLFWGVVAALAAGGALVFAGMAIIFVYWDTHRLLAAAMVTAAWFVLAAVAGLT